MSHLIACRIASYAKFRDVAWDHLPEIGIKNIEIEAPAPGEVDALRKRLADHGLTATSLQAKCDITSDESVEVMRPQLEACKQLGAKICFLSVKVGDGDRQAAYKRLQQIGEIAAGFGVTVALETHPDMVTNGDVGRETINAVNHPNIRINFDPANLYYYNKDIDAVKELEKVIDVVAAVHLKDTNGKFETWHFPALGEGIVDFPTIFKMLDDRGFTGPYTMELEGIKGVEYDADGRKKDVADSVTYLRRIGVMD